MSKKKVAVGVGAGLLAAASLITFGLIKKKKNQEKEEKEAVKKAK